MVKSTAFWAVPEDEDGAGVVFGAAVVTTVAGAAAVDAGVVVVVTDTVETTDADVMTVASGMPCTRFAVRPWSNARAQRRNSGAGPASCTGPDTC